MGIRLIKQGVICDTALDDFSKAYLEIENLNFEHGKELIRHKEKLKETRNVIKQLNLKNKQCKEQYRKIYLLRLEIEKKTDEKLAQIEKEQESNRNQIEALKDRMINFANNSRQEELSETKNLINQLNLKNKQFKEQYRKEYSSILNIINELSQIEEEKQSNKNQIKALKEELLSADRWQSDAKNRIHKILLLGNLNFIDKNKRCVLSFNTPKMLAEFIENQELEPQPIILKPFCNDNKKFDDEAYFLFKKNLYYIDSGNSYTLKEQQLIVKEYYFKHKSKFERLQREIRLYERLELKNEISREPIPEEVRFAVWRRDRGKCVKCGSNEKLEFDHIIPVSKGGSSTERNVQLLCERCNRGKSDKI
jgi:hypothetical protein